MEWVDLGWVMGLNKRLVGFYFLVENCGGVLFVFCFEDLVVNGVII
jgi:hypothetical protein